MSISIRSKSMLLHGHTSLSTDGGPLAVNVITGSHIVDNVISTAKIVDGAISFPKMVPGARTFIYVGDETEVSVVGQTLTQVKDIRFIRDAAGPVQLDTFLAECELMSDTNLQSAVAKFRVDNESTDRLTL